MKIHSDKLTSSDLYAMLPSGVSAHITPKGSRSRAHAFDVTLYVFERDELHRSLCNSGQYGAGGDIAATWDEWGIWMARIYERDPRAMIGWYRSHDHFVEMTTRERNRVRATAKPHHVKYKTHTAPWLDDDFDAERRAREAGYEAGKAAGSWVIDGNTSEETARAILQGLEDGDPEILDMLPSSPLSGEWADAPMPRDVLEEVGKSEDDNDASEILDAYEEGYAQGVEDEVGRAASLLANHDQAMEELAPKLNAHPSPLAQSIAAKRLEELRAALRAERISYGELAELQSLADMIPLDDVELREAAGCIEN